MKLVLTGDLHLGRRSSLLGESGGAAHRAAGAWARVVDLAVAEQATVLIAGDLIDQENRFYEARGPLRDGLDRLQQAGLTAYAVAGNHDAEALPYLADHLHHPALQVVGRDGQWETIRVQHDDEAVELLGWSFPGPAQESSPLPAAWPERTPGVPAIGLLHCDVDAARSRYAPVAAAALAAASRDLWVVGHQHAPRRIEVGGRPAALYVGSPQALDPGESGAHGCWLLELAPGRPPRPEFRPLSTVRYETPSIDLSGVADKAGWDARVQAAIDALTETVSRESAPWVEVASVRPTFTGEAGVAAELPGWYDALAAADTFTGSPAVVFDRFSDATTPAVDLAGLATRGDPPGRLARLLLELDTDPLGETAASLVEQGTARLSELDREVNYQPVARRRGDQDTRAEARARLRTQARRMLSALLASRGDS